MTTGKEGEKEGKKRMKEEEEAVKASMETVCLLYTSPSPRDAHESRMPSSA